MNRFKFAVTTALLFNAMMDGGNAAASAAPEIPKALKLDNLEKAFFKPAQFADAQAAIQKSIEICKANNVQPKWGFDPQKQIPDGYGILIAPINVNDPKQKKNVTIGVWFTLIPLVDAVMAIAAGAEFVKDAAQKNLITYFINTVRPKRDDDGNITESINSVPSSIDDFITAGKRESALEFFNESAETFVDALRKNGIEKLTKPIFKQVLSSAPFARQLYPSIPQEQWKGVINVMIASAQKRGANPGILVDWLETRENTEIKLVRENASIDLNALAALGDE